MAPSVALYLAVLVASTWAQSINSRAFDTGEWVPMSQPCPTCHDGQKVEDTQQLQDKTARVLNTQVAFQRNFFPGQQSQRSFSSPTQQPQSENQKQLKNAPVISNPTENKTPQFPPRLDQANFNQLPYHLQTNPPFITQGFINQNGQFIVTPQSQQPRLIQPQNDFQLIQQVLHNSNGQFAESIFSVNNQSLAQDLNNYAHLPKPSSIQQYDRESSESKSVPREQEKINSQTNQPQQSTPAVQDKQDIQLVYVPLETYRQKGYQNQRQQQQQVSPTVSSFQSTVPSFIGSTNVYNTQFLQSTLQPQNLQPHNIQQQILLPQNLQQQLLHLQNVQQNLQNTHHQFFQTEAPTTVEPIISTTSKTSKSKAKRPKPHQPPLAVYMEAPNHDPVHVNVTDVLTLLKDAKTISVLDNVAPDSPQVFIGPKNLNPPEGYVKFELPYLSNIENNRIQRKVDQLPFFVAPLSYKAPEGYAKIPFPAPHVGSVVVSTMKEPLHEKQEPKPTQSAGVDYFSNSQETASPSPSTFNHLSSTLAPQYLSNPDVLLNPFSAFIQASQLPDGSSTYPTTNQPSSERTNQFNPSGVTNYFTSPRSEGTTTPPQYSVRGHFITNTVPSRQTIQPESQTQRTKYRTDFTDIPNTEAYTVLEQFPITQEVGTQKETKVTENTTPSYRQFDLLGNPLAFGINDQLGNIQSTGGNHDLQSNRHLNRQQKQQNVQSAQEIAQQIYNHQFNPSTEKTQFAESLFLNQQLQDQSIANLEDQLNRQQNHRLRSHNVAVTTTTERVKSTTPEQQFRNTFVPSTVPPNIEITSEYIEEYPYYVEQQQQPQPQQQQQQRTRTKHRENSGRTPIRSRGKPHVVQQQNLETSSDVSQEGFSLPPNLPPINPNLPGLINSLQDNNYPQQKQQQVSIVPNIYRQQQVSETPNIYRQTAQQVTELPTIYQQTQQVSETPNIYKQTTQQVQETPTIYRQTTQQVSETPSIYRQTTQQVQETPSIYRQTTQQVQETPTIYRQTTQQVQETPSIYRQTVQVSESPYRQTIQDVSETPIIYQQGGQQISVIPNGYQQVSSTPNVYQQTKQIDSSTPEYIVSPLTEPSTSTTTEEPITTTRRPIIRGRTRLSTRPVSSTVTTSTTPAPKRNAPRRRRPYNGRPRPEYEKYLQNHQSSRNENQYASSSTEAPDSVKTVSENSYSEVSTRSPVTKSRYSDYQNDSQRNKFSTYQDSSSKNKYSNYQDDDEQQKRLNRQRFRTRARPTKSSTEAPSVSTENIDAIVPPMTERSDTINYSTEQATPNFQTPKLESGFQISPFVENQQSVLGSQYNEQVVPLSQQQPQQNSIYSNIQSDAKYQNVQNIPQEYQTQPKLYQHQQDLNDQLNQAYQIQNQQLQQQLQQSQDAGHRAIQQILEERDRQTVSSTFAPIQRNSPSSTLRVQPDVIYPENNGQYIQQTVQQIPQSHSVQAVSPETTHKPLPTRIRGRTRTRSRHYSSTQPIPVSSSSTSTTTTEKQIHSQETPKEESEEEFYGFIRQPNFKKPTPTVFPTSLRPVEESSPQYIQIVNPSPSYASPTVASLAAVAGDEHINNYQGLVNSVSTEGAKYSESDEITTRRPSVNFLHRGRVPGPRPTAFPVTPTAKAESSHERYTVRPTKKPEVEQKVTRIRGRIRKPIHPTSTESVAASSPAVVLNNQPTYAGRRPYNHKSPTGSNELIDADSEEVVTNRRTPNRYVNRGRTQFKVPATATEKLSGESDETDNYPNYPAAFLEAQQAQHQETRTLKPEFRITVGPSDDYEDSPDQVPYATVNHPRVVPQNPEDGGAESQWHSKKYVSTSFRQNNLISPDFKNDSDSKIVEDIGIQNRSSEIRNENTENEDESVVTTESTDLGVTDIPLNTTNRTEDASIDSMQSLLEKFIDEMTGDESEESTTENIQTTSTTEKSKRRGAWKRVRVRPTDVLETAESQNVAASASNSLISDSAKKMYPRPTIEQYKITFEPESEETTVSVTTPAIVEGQGYEIISPKINDNETGLNFDLVPPKESENEESVKPVQFNSQIKETISQSENEQTFELIPPNVPESDESIRFNQESEFTTPASEPEVTTEGTIFDSLLDMFGFSNKNETNEQAEVTTDKIEQIVVTTTTVPEILTEVTTVEQNSETTTEIIETTEASNLNKEDIELLKTQQLNETRIISDKIKMYTERKDEQERLSQTTDHQIIESEKGWESLIIGTSTSTEVSHETEICFRGKCVRSNQTENNNGKK